MRIVSVNPRAHLLIDGSRVLLTRPEEYRDLWLWVNHVARHNKGVQLCIREG